MEPIAFVGNDHLLYVLDAPDAEPPAPRCLTPGEPDAAFTWPTWAPGRDAVAVMRRVRDDGQRGAVELRAVADGAARRLWTARDGGPVFLHWAPGGRHLGMLVQEADDLHLLVADRESSGEARALLTGAPLYWSWAPDGAALVAHVGGHYRRGQEARVLLVRLDAGPDAVEVLSARPLGFRAPAWEPGGARLAYAAADYADGRALVVLDPRTGQSEEVAAVGHTPAFVWAHAGGRLALAAERTEAGLYDGITVLDVASGATRRLPQRALAFFWTPADDALLCVGVDAAGEVLTWERVDPASGAARTLAQFAPTQELALMLGHFDQYAPAVRLYSGEAAALLFAHTSQDSRHNGHSAEHAGLWLASDADPPALRHLAGGSIGFFAP